jgi:hypothetical protein
MSAAATLASSWPMLETSAAVLSIFLSGALGSRVTPAQA